jgi:hypothetical protein
LTHATLPGVELILRNVELTVDYVRIARVRIKRVRVDLKRDFLEETLTRVITVLVKDGIRSIGTRTRKRRGRSVNYYVNNHISEEITVLRYRDLGSLVERNIVRSDLEVLAGNRNIWLEVGVDEKYVRLFDITKRWVDIGFTGGGTSSLYRVNVIAKDTGSKEELIHSPFIGD